MLVLRSQQAIEKGLCLEMTNSQWRDVSEFRKTDRKTFNVQRLHYATTHEIAMATAMAALSKMLA